MNTAILHINELLDSLDITMFPYVKGNCIYVGKSCVRKENNHLYKVFYSKNKKNFIINESKKKRKIYIRKRRSHITNTLFGYGFTKRIYTNEFLLNTIKDENGRVKTYKRNVYKDQNGIKHIETIEESTIL